MSLVVKVYCTGLGVEGIRGFRVIDLYRACNLGLKVGSVEVAALSSKCSLGPSSAA